MKILAVDDDSYVLELVQLIAARAGFPNVATASSGQEALDALARGETKFDCLLLDINMPGIDGIDLCARVRQIPEYRATPIIMLTAMSEREYMERAFKAGATDYATKPFDVHELGARLRIAQELIAARRVAQSDRLSADVSTSPANQGHPFSISDAIFIDGVKDLCELGAFKNFLCQSSRAGLAASQLIAIKIDRVQEIYNRAHTEEFLYALREVALAADEVVRGTGGLISYAGGGTFLIVSSSSVPVVSNEMEADLQFLLDERSAEYDDGTPMDLEVSIGNPLQPNHGSVTDLEKTLERAIARAEFRSANKNCQHAKANIRQLRL